jgi:hypothetical protein
MDCIRRGEDNVFMDVSYPFADLSIIVQQASANMMYLAKSSRRVTQITERIDARRRQYPDIDEDLQ